MKKIPVTILSGFLGAGKTTFLNHILEKNKHIRYAIIENEFGEQGIDGELVIRPEQTIVELNNGCLCCTLNDNLYDILNTLFERREEFDELIIEATGVADPAGLAQPFLAHPLIKKHFPLKGIICLVDAELIEDHIKETEEAKAQVAFSDVLYINKTDLIAKSYIDVLVKKLQEINPLASIVSGNRNNFPAINLNEKDSELDKLFLQSNQLITLKENENNFPVQKPHDHHPHKHTKEIVSHTFIYDTPFSFTTLEQHLFVYLKLQSQGLYRMKGFVSVDGADSQYLIQSVGNHLDVEVKRSWKTGEMRKSTLVFIGKNLQRQGLEKLLNKCISKKHTITLNKIK